MTVAGVAAAVALGTTGVLGGCAHSVGPVQLVPAPASSTSAPGNAHALSPLGPPPSLRPVPPLSVAPSFADGTAVACAGRPTSDQVVAVLRRTSGLLPAGSAVTVQTGPLCAGSWQYTVIVVTGREPLRVVTRGAPTTLSLVTAGTDVCTAEVRAAAPLGILALTFC